MSKPSFLPPALHAHHLTRVVYHVVPTACGVQQAGQFKQLATRIASVEGTTHGSLARLQEALAAYQDQLRDKCRTAVAELRVTIAQGGAVNPAALRATLHSLSAPVPDFGLSLDSGHQGHSELVQHRARDTALRVVPLIVAELACNCICDSMTYVHVYPTRTLPRA